MVIVSLTLISLMCSGPTLITTQLLFGPTTVTTCLVAWMASIVATVVMTPASLSSCVGPACVSSMNRSETAIAKTPFTAATMTLMYFPPLLTLNEKDYQLKVRPSLVHAARYQGHPYRS